jgi:signal recognition particle receptor subunit beta
MGTSDPDSVGEMTSLATESDRTLFFDFVPIDLGKIGGFNARFQLFTVPGQVFYNETRKIVLKDCDGVVFVADSAPSALVNNMESLRNLEENLTGHGKSLSDVPVVIQYNKQDLADAMSVEELEELLNGKVRAPSFKASAEENWGVMETLAKISTLVLEHLRESMQDPKAASPQSVKRVYSKEGVDDDAVVGELMEDIAAARAKPAEDVSMPAAPAPGPSPAIVPEASPVETSSIRPEDLLAEFDDGPPPPGPPPAFESSQPSVPSVPPPQAVSPPPPPPAMDTGGGVAAAATASTRAVQPPPTPGTTRNVPVPPPVGSGSHAQPASELLDDVPAAPDLPPAAPEGVDVSVVRADVPSNGHGRKPWEDLDEGPSTTGAVREHSQGAALPPAPATAPGAPDAWAMDSQGTPAPLADGQVEVPVTLRNETTGSRITVSIRVPAVQRAASSGALVYALVTGGA